jgi:hypothetical protein
MARMPVTPLLIAAIIVALAVAAYLVGVPVVAIAVGIGVSGGVWMAYAARLRRSRSTESQR